MDNIAVKLKELIERDGPEIFVNTPYEVSRELLNGNVTDRKTASALLHTILMGIPALFTDNREHSQEEISKVIQKEWCLKKGISDQIAETYLSLYSKENEASWDGKRLAGMEAFMEQKWEFEWDGDATWEHVLVIDGIWKTAPGSSECAEKIS